MADTATEPLPNGNAALTTEEEEERMRQRPADIDADVREMERRKRVEALMSSKLFREELERVLDQQMHEGGDAPLLQRIREMVGGRLHTGTFRSPSCVLPINDIRGIEGFGYEKGEKILRCKLAACYRLVDLFGWTQTGTNGQITARLNTAVEQVLTTPRGLLPHEVTASSLVKVDMQGVVQDQGTTNFPVNVEGFSLHASVHAARPDLRCVLHVRAPAALAVSSTRRGLLPLGHEAAVLGVVAYHHVPPGILDNEEHEKLVRALGPSAKVLMLSGCGALCCGASLEEAFHHARQLTAACEIQLRVASVPLDDLRLMDDETRQKMYEQSRAPPAGDAKWRVGGEEFEALMRMLDNAGFRTGYIYRHPLIKNEVPKPKNDVEVPPAVSSLGYLLEEEELYRQGIWKKGTGKAGERTRWLNSPNVYQKVEVLETGTSDPKKITKWVDANNEEWVQDGSPAHSSTPVKIDTLQFVPKNTNPKEFKALQQQIKDNRRADKISAGPQSHILEGVTWDEANKLVGEDAVNTHTGDHVVLMGAASKGIIQRGHQHNATVYSAPYARNPFEHVTDRDIDEYKRQVERRARPDYDTDLSESEAISAAQITSPASATETEEESRDEHRVLRIETKQVPVRSQPEVVLSDGLTNLKNRCTHLVNKAKGLNRRPSKKAGKVFNRYSSMDTTDFLHAERSHAERTRVSDRDPNLLSDDEVFLDSPVGSTASSAVASPAPTAVAAPVTVVRVQAGVLRGTKLTPEANEALSTNKRSLHDYSRNSNVDRIIQKYNDDKKHPKCKVSLNDRLEVRVDDVVDVNDDARIQELDNLNEIAVDLAVGVEVKQVNKDDHIDVGRKSNQGDLSSRSSLYSIASIEWDGLRTQSLPRRRTTRSTNLFRTRSYSGFANSYIKDPEPYHFHIPKCRSCGSSTNSYVWELNKERKNQKAHSVYFSVDNIHQECQKENLPDIVTVKEKIVPVFKVAEIQDEFVESQEFNEDNYLTDLNSFSSENQTVIEKVDENDVTVTEINVIKDDMQVKDTDTDDVYKAEIVQVETENPHDSQDSNEGEYHSFSDDIDLEDIYESPVKDLVEKDIRDYSVPINFYCEDYTRKESPKKSPKKIIAVVKDNIILEPILEESKSSYDESNSFNNDSNNIKRDSDAGSASKEITETNVEITDSLMIETHNKYFEADKPLKDIEIEKSDIFNKDSPGTESPYVQYKDETAFQKETRIENVQKSTELSVISDATNTSVEIIFKIPEVIPTKQMTVSKYREFTPRNSDDYSIASSTELVSFDSTAEFEKYEVVTDILSKILNQIDLRMNEDSFVHDFVNENDGLRFDYKNLTNESKSDVSEQLDNDQTENFSITKIIQEIEGTAIFNETVSTEISEVDSRSHKIAEAIVYFIFDRACSYRENEVKSKTRKVKRVVTIVDREDIMFTAADLWIEPGDPNVDSKETFSMTEYVKVEPRETVEISQIGPDSTVAQCYKTGSFITSDLEVSMGTVSIEKSGKEYTDDIAEQDLEMIHPVTEAIDRLFQYLNEEIESITNEKPEIVILYDSIKYTSEVNENNAPTIELQEYNNNYEEPVFDHLNNNVAVTGQVDYDTYDHADLVQESSGNNSNTVVDFEKKVQDEKLLKPCEIPINNDELDSKAIQVSNEDAVVLYEKEILVTHAYHNEVHSKVQDDSEQYDIDDEVELRNVQYVDIDKEALHKSNDDELCGTDSEILIKKDSCEIPINNDELDSEAIEVSNEAVVKNEKEILVPHAYHNEVHSKVQDDGEQYDIDEVELRNVQYVDIDTEALYKSNEDELCGSYSETLIKTYDLNETHDINAGAIHDTMDDTSFDDRNATFITENHNINIGINELHHNITYNNEVVATEAEYVENFNETFVIVPEEASSATLESDMNTAFVQDDYYNRSSSPNAQKTNFEACTESPIVNISNSNSSALYEKDDSILGSPFVKRASVISMEQTEHRGGVKYWLSFDESLTEDRDINYRPVKKFSESKIPSFFAVDFDNDLHDSYETSFKRSSVLLEGCSKDDSNVVMEESFITAKALNSDNYETCESELIENMPQKMLLYNTKSQYRTKQRLYSTWPPFEDTLFYRLISKFRMSESFDPSDLENMDRADNTL